MLTVGMLPGLWAKNALRVRCVVHFYTRHGFERVLRALRFIKCLFVRINISTHYLGGTVSMNLGTHAIESLMEHEIEH